MNKRQIDWEKEMAQLKAKIALLEEVMSEEKLDAERALELIETEAAIDISNIVDACEKKTGRPFELIIKSGQPASQAKVVANFAKERKLKAMVKILAKHASTRYGWGKCKFKEWAEPIFDDEWDKNRR